LSTLLSCAAAARGLPRTRERGGSVEGLRVVQSATPPSSVASAAKRKKSKQEKEKKRRDTTRDMMVTLAISAGAVVVLAAVSFSAGYWVRRELAGLEEVRKGRVKP